MKHNSFCRLSTAITLSCFLSFSLVASSQETRSKENRENREKKTRDFNDVSEQLDRAAQKLERDLGKLNATASFDGEKLKRDLERSLKSLDAAKLRTDLAKMNVDLDNAKAALERLRENELPRIEAELKGLGPRMENELRGARESIEKARGDIKEYKAFEEGLSKDGLIGKDNYTIEHKDGVLKIDGKVQPAEIYNRYRGFLEKRPSFKLRKNEHDLHIDHD
jgi:hypothetical protein